VLTILKIFKERHCHNYSEKHKQNLNNHKKTPTLVQTRVGLETPLVDRDFGTEVCEVKSVCCRNAFSYLLNYLILFLTARKRISSFTVVTPNNRTMSWTLLRAYVTANNLKIVTKRHKFLVASEMICPERHSAMFRNLAAQLQNLSRSRCIALHCLLIFWNRNSLRRRRSDMPRDWE